MWRGPLRQLARNVICSLGPTHTRHNAVHGKRCLSQTPILRQNAVPPPPRGGNSATQNSLPPSATSLPKPKTGDVRESTPFVNEVKAQLDLSPPGGVDAKTKARKKKIVEYDIKDNFDGTPYPSQRLPRQPVDELPSTVIKLETKDGCMVYVVGTNHISKESQEDVAKTIHAVQPDIVVLELCRRRAKMLELDEDTSYKKILQDARNPQIRTDVKKNGILEGALFYLLRRMSAQLTKEFGVAPGGEFRRALKEAKTIPGCRVHLGDRPIEITGKRLLHALTWREILGLGLYSFKTKNLRKEDIIEKWKQKDVLEEIMKELKGFPAVYTVIVQERDILLANSLNMAARPLPHPELDGDVIPSVVVGVVGIGHLQGIKEQWDKEHNGIS